MTTLFLVNGLPYPPRSGAPLRSWHILCALARLGDVEVMSFGGREPGEYTLPDIARWKHYDGDAYASKRGPLAVLRRLVRSRQFPLRDADAAGAINADLRAAIARIKPDLVVLSHWKNALPAALAGRSDIALDMHNVESLLGTDVKKVRSAFKRRLILWRWRARERKLIKQAARVWTCSADDSALVAQLGGDPARIFVVPNVVDTERYDAIARGAVPTAPELHDARPTIIFVAYFGYEPNATAAARLIEDIFPRIVQRVPRARLVLVGGEPTPLMRSAASSNVIVTGKVDDVRPYLAAAQVCVVPLASGGGTRLKILEAFAAGIPVVSTPKGAEGIAARSGEHLIIAQSSDDIATATATLLSDPVKAASLRTAARELVDASYSSATLQRAVERALPRDVPAARPAVNRTI